MRRTGTGLLEVRDFLRVKLDLWLPVQKSGTSVCQRSGRYWHPASAATGCEQNGGNLTQLWHRLQPWNLVSFRMLQTASPYNNTKNCLKLSVYLKLSEKLTQHRLPVPLGARHPVPHLIMAKNSQFTLPGSEFIRVSRSSRFLFCFSRRSSRFFCSFSTSFTTLLRRLAAGIDEVAVNIRQIGRGRAGNGGGS